MASLEHWIRLSKTGASAARLNWLLGRFGSPEALFSLSPDRLAADTGLPASAAQRLLDPQHAVTAEELALIEQLEVRLIPRGDPAYPRLLAEIHDPPPLLYVRGTLEPTDERAVALVGTRNASPYGRQMAERLARDLAGAGVTVVSGLARGIDTHAHRGALAGGGRTLAVLGCGVDVQYPWANRDLAERIRQSGALISEYPMGEPPDAWHFPTRNRMVSGLSLGVVLLEAARGSGALITVSCATDQNREVFAVPGRVDDPRNQGPHGLLRDGARLVESVEDILSELRLTAEPPQSALPLEEPELTDDERRLWALLSQQPKHIDDLILESDVPPADVSATLMMLEIKGLAQRQPGNLFLRSR